MLSPWLQAATGLKGGRREGRGQREAGFQSQGQLNHIQHQLGCTQAISFSAQHVCNTRSNHPAAILLSAVYQGRGRNAWPRPRIAWLTACSEEQSLCYQLLWVSCRCTRGHLAANALATLSAKKKRMWTGRRDIMGVMPLCTVLLHQSRCVPLFHFVLIR